MSNITQSRRLAATVLFACLSSGIAGADAITREVILDAGAPLIRLWVEPSAGVAAYAVEEFLEVGSVPMDISEGGWHDTANRLLKWGPFTDNVARLLSYRLTGPQGGTTVNAFLVHPDGGAVSGQAVIQMPDPNANFHGWRANRLDPDQLQTLASHPDSDMNGNGLSLFKEYTMGIGSEAIFPVPEAALVRTGATTFNFAALLNSEAADLQIVLERSQAGGPWQALNLAELGISPVNEPLLGFEPAGRLSISGLNLGSQPFLVRLRVEITTGEP